MATEQSMPALRKVVATLFSIALATAFLPGTALASTASTADQDAPVTAQALATDVWGSCTWTLENDGTLKITATNGRSGELEDMFNSAPWTAFAEQITSVKFGTGVKLPESASGMFRGCANIESIDFNGLDTSNTTTMASMFAQCSSLETLDLSGFDTKNLQSMRGIFNSCSSLIYLDLSSFNTVDVYDMKQAFISCDSLKRVKIGENFWFQVGVELPDGEWASAETGQTYTAAEITSQRSHIADTYTNLSLDFDPPVIASDSEEPVEWTKGSKEGLTFRSDALFILFDGVKIDGETIDPENYTAAEGSTIITLKPDYVEALESGEHEIGIVSATGTASSKFTVADDPNANEPDDPTPPQQEDPKQDEPKQEDPKQDEPKQEDPKQDEPKQEEPKQEQPAEDTTPMYRLYNPNSGEHFYTADADEKAILKFLGWEPEGIAWTAPADGTPVYRLYNPNTGEHHYTTDPFERGKCVGWGWNDEGIGWYADTQQRVNVYRVYNPNAYSNNHHYTTDASERDILLGLGWDDEGIGWHAVS